MRFHKSSMFLALQRSIASAQVLKILLLNQQAEFRCLSVLISQQVEAPSSIVLVHQLHELLCSKGCHRQMKKINK